MKAKALSIFPVVALTAAIWAGCSGGDAATGDQQNVNAACEVFSVRDNRNLTADELSKLGDPIAKRVLLNGCAQNLNGIIDSMSKATDCQGGSFSTRLVSERAVLLGQADSYRGVLSQNCNGGTDHDVFVSIFGISPGAGQLPQDGIEVIGKDPTGVLNYYVNEGGWKFMGSSKDAVSDGYDCDANGACEPKSAKKARCWGCHESGGINMKELNSPWSNWQNPPGSQDVFTKFGKQLGSNQDGINMEVRTENANTEWNKQRIEVLKTKGAAELLRPLFCTLTSSLQTTGSANSVSSIPGEFFVDVPNGGEVFFQGIGWNGGSVSVNAADYADLLKTNGQKIVDRSGRQLQGKSGPVVDHPNGMMFIKKGDIDRRYIKALVDAKVIDEDFVRDVLHVDFTRPVFSAARCGLLTAAPKISGADLTPDKIRDGFKAGLANVSSAAGQTLLKNLGDPADAAAHQKDIDAFFAACNARTDKKQLLAEVLQYNAHLKAAIKAHRTNTPDGPVGIIEFNETLATDSLGDTKQSFDPTSCTLK